MGDFKKQPRSRGLPEAKETDFIIDYLFFNFLVFFVVFCNLELKFRLEQSNSNPWYTTDTRVPLPTIGVEPDNAPGYLEELDEEGAI